MLQVDSVLQKRKNVLVMYEKDTNTASKCLFLFPCGENQVRILRRVSLYWTYSVCAALAIGCRHSYTLRIVWIAKCIYIAGWVPCRSFA